MESSNLNREGAMTSQATALSWCEAVLQKGEAALGSKKSSPPPPHVIRHGPDPPYLNVGLVQEFRAAGLSFIRAVFGETHSHYTEFEKSCRNGSMEETLRGTAILRAIRSELDSGYISRVQDLLRAEVFADFLEMAEHLLVQGYKDPAAVMIGSVLEDHLRQLATKQSIPVSVEKDGKQVPKKADTLNAELKKAEAYGALDQKAITAWLDLRNNAAHGKYEQYTNQQVQNMLSGVLEFVRRVSLK